MLASSLCVLMAAVLFSQAVETLPAAVLVQLQVVAALPHQPQLQLKRRPAYHSSPSSTRV